MLLKILLIIYFMGENENEFSKSDFTFIGVIGRGAFGKVLKVEHKKTKRNYAMKVMNKLKIIDMKAVNNANNERNILVKINNQ